MTGVGTDAQRTLDQFVDKTNKRLIALERQLTKIGSVDLSRFLVAGNGIQFTGAGTTAEPYAINLASTSVTDWDDAITPGFFWSDAALNTPTGMTAWGETIGTYFQGTVTTNPASTLDDTRIVQEIHETNRARMGIAYRRYWNGAEWSAWEPDDPRDSGWVDLSSYLIGGFTGSSTAFLARRIGPDVDIRASLTAPALTSGTSVFELAANIPVVWRPVTRSAWGAGYISGNSVSAIMREAGTMAISARLAANTTAGASLQFSIRYFLG